MSVVRPQKFQKRQPAPAESDEALRLLEAVLFAASEPLDQKALSTSLPDGADIIGLLAALEEQYQKRGVKLNRLE